MENPFETTKAFALKKTNIFVNKTRLMWGALGTPKGMPKG